MAENRRKKQKRLPLWKHAGETKKYIHEKLFKPDENETLLIHKQFKIK